MGSTTGPLWLPRHKTETLLSCYQPCLQHQPNILCNCAGKKCCGLIRRHASDMFCCFMMVAGCPNSSRTAPAAFAAPNRTAKLPTTPAALYSHLPNSDTYTSTYHNSIVLLPANHVQPSLNLFTRGARQHRRLCTSLRTQVTPQYKQQLNYTTPQPVPAANRKLQS